MPRLVLQRLQQPLLLLWRHPGSQGFERSCFHQIRKLEELAKENDKNRFLRFPFFVIDNLVFMMTLWA